MWLDSHFQSGDRPDRIGVMFSVHAVKGTPVITAHELRPDASRSGRAKTLIEQLAEGFFVLVISADGAQRRVACADPRVRRLFPSESLFHV